MNADPLRAGSGGEEDSWETLAEDLFGIDLGAKPPADAQISSEDLMLDEPAPTAAQPKPAEPVPAEPTQPAGERKEPERSERQGPRRRDRGPARPPRPERAAPPPPADDDFGADLDLEAPFGGSRTPELDSSSEDFTEAEDAAQGEEPAKSEPHRHRPERAREERRERSHREPHREEQSREQPPTEESEEAAASGGPEEGDTYWDPLKNWQWSEERESSHQREESRDRGGRRGGGGRGGRGGRGERGPGRRESGGRRRERGERSRGGEYRSEDSPHESHGEEGLREERPPHRSRGRSEGEHRSERRDRSEGGRRSEGRRGERPRSEGPRREGHPTQRGPERPVRSEPPRSAPPASDYLDDFGVGLIDTGSPAEPAAPERREEHAVPERAHGGDWDEPRVADERGSEAGFGVEGDREEIDEFEDREEGGATETERPFEEGERRPRRRRRRRRSRSRRERPAGPMDRERHVSDEGTRDELEPERYNEESPDRGPSDEVEELAEEPHFDEGALEEVDEAAAETESEEPEGPRRRRRRRRGRGGREERGHGRPAAAGATVESQGPAEESFDEDLEEEESGDLTGESELSAEDEEGEEAPRVYRNVPTWEEAISYLVHKRPSEGRSRDDSGPGGPREPRRDGGGRPR